MIQHSKFLGAGAVAKAAPEAAAREAGHSSGPDSPEHRHRHRHRQSTQTIDTDTDTDIDKDTDTG